MKIKPSKTVISVAISNLFRKELLVTAPQGRQILHPTLGSNRPQPRLIQSEPNQEPERFEKTEAVVDWRLAEIKQKVSDFAHQGRLSYELINLLCKDGLCAPVEFELLDYKEKFDVTPYGKGKLALTVVSFFNSFGGYLVFGVQETESETRFDIVGVNPVDFDIESLKALVKEFTGERIQVSAVWFEANRCDGTSAQVLFLHIPKRPTTIPPLHFLKDGPGNDKKKPVFLKDTVYCRRADECLEAKGPRILELNGERRNPYIFSDAPVFSGMFRVNRIPHNLPDRNFICPRFIGRDSVVNALWRWLGDDLSHVKVLAGEGGLGKSSIAFEFAERISETHDAPFEQVVWITAKELQFNAFEDKYIKVPERHYRSYEELLMAICERLPFTSAELQGATITELKRMVRNGLVDTPSLIIIDDVDSLPTEEQRQVLELGMLLGSSASRLLLTTRFNQSYSSDNVIKLSGFSLEDEFHAYLDALRERLQFPDLKASEIEKIHLTSGGSPLFSESLLRLLRWHNVNEAISLWKNERGTAVRAAALKREVELLSPEAQRILLTIALLGEASTVELCEVLGYPSEMIETGLAELLSLFLVAAPALASIRRFRVPDNTRRLVVDPGTVLVTDRSRLEKDIEEFRRKGTSTRDSRVAGAISQAAALLRVGEVGPALATIKDARTRTQDHFDLLCYQANLHLKTTPPQIVDARTLARRAFTKGCRKPEVFECWFEAEWLAKHYIGALEAAEAALANKSPGTQDWLIRKSAALANKSSDQAKTGTIEGAVSTMFEASTGLRQAISQSRRDDTVDWETRQAELHDQIWIWAGVDQVGLGRTVAQMDTLEKMWRLGDTRITNLRRILSAIDGMVVLIDRKLSHLSRAQINICGSLVSRAQELFRSRRQRFPEDFRHKQLDSALESLLIRVDEAVSRREAKTTNASR